MVQDGLAASLCFDCRRPLRDCRTCLECGGRLYEMGRYGARIEYACFAGHGWHYYSGYVGAGKRWRREDEIAEELLAELDHYSTLHALRAERELPMPA